MWKANRLIYADSDKDADMLYAVGMFVPDPFIYLELKGRRYVVVSDLEIDRARNQAKGCEVMSLQKIMETLRKRKQNPADPALAIQEALRPHRVRRLQVPASFPLGLSKKLDKLGVRVEPADGAFWKERETKTDVEIRHLTQALRIAEQGMEAGMQALRDGKIGKNGRLTLGGETLTSEKLRGLIDSAVIQAGGTASHTIVAGGDQACDPHECGFGPLKAHRPIILDIFPRSQKTGYFGDITRTVVKGKASDAVKGVYHAVFEGQKIAFQAMKAGVRGKSVHEKVQKYFKDCGYETGCVDGKMQGFFHGTGHGLGLEIHEAPRTGPTSTHTLRSRQVITVEPGLYYPGVGGVRLEDVAVVGPKGSRNLTRYPKFLEIP